MRKGLQTEAQFLGDLSPLVSADHLRKPDRRQVSKRWLLSSVLVGATSLLLMGGALNAALDGREKLTVPPEIYQRVEKAQNGIVLASKGPHPAFIARSIRSEPSNIKMVSTMSLEGASRVVKVRPFLKVQAGLAVAPIALERYPAFNALNIFSETSEEEIIAKSNSVVYGADVEGEVTYNLIDFPYEAVSTVQARQTPDDVLRQVRNFAQNGNISSSIAISLFDADRFSNRDSFIDETVRITAENVSSLRRINPSKWLGTRYLERLVEIRADANIPLILEGEGVSRTEIEELTQALVSDLATDLLRKGDTVQLHLKLETDSFGNPNQSVMRTSVYRGTTHLVTVARNDRKALVYTAPPALPPELIDLQETPEPVIATGNLPSLYDGLYRAALSEGLNQDLAEQLIKIFAFDVDFKTRISPGDTLQLFVSLEEGEEKPTQNSEILYAGLKHGKLTRRYYRFRDPQTGRVDYYDETGKSAKKFLLRQPVPNGKFRSPYGMRRHPISRVWKLHAGVDWSAPRGTPILASGNGLVEQAKWAGGYGRQTVIRHANGYETSYSHQTRFARGIRPGVRVRQGQVIGYVGSTGYSTGPHLHYEVKVNGRTVDPMRIRLPKGEVLKDEELQAFLAERDRIDTLVGGENEPQEVASN